MLYNVTILGLVLIIELLTSSCGPREFSLVKNLTAAETIYVRKLLRDYQLNPKDQEPVVVGIRGRAFDGTTHDTQTRPVYDDVFYVVSAKGKIKKFPGSTHPWDKHSRNATDANGDGTPDVGMIRPDVYKVKKRTKKIAGLSSYDIFTLAGSGRIPGWRDVNHDGIYSDGEKHRSTLRQDTLTAVLFHAGGPKAPPAIGCQILPPDEMPDFIDELSSSIQFRYLLIEVF